jgi:hypothetical protein
MSESQPKMHHIKTEFAKAAASKPKRSLLRQRSAETVGQVPSSARRTLKNQMKGMIVKHFAATAVNATRQQSSIHDKKAMALLL